MYLKAEKCSVCGKTEREGALLGARLEHLGGVGNIVVVVCRDDARACWRRKDQKENGGLARNQTAA